MLQPPIDASHRELSDDVSHDSVLPHLPWAIAIQTTIRTFDFDFLSRLQHQSFSDMSLDSVFDVESESVLRFYFRGRLHPFSALISLSL